MGVSEPYEPGQEVVSTTSTGQVPSQVDKSTSGNGGGGGWLSGLAGSLRGGLSTGTRSGESRRGLPPAGTYKIGEVKAEYVKVCPMSIINLSSAP